MNVNLISLAEAGKTAAVQSLFSKSCNLNAKNDQGWTALMLAAAKGHFETVEILLNNGVDINAKSDKSGCTALMLAAWFGHTAIVEALLNNGARVNIKSDSGKTALMAAAFQEDTKTVKLLQCVVKNNSELLDAVRNYNIYSVHALLNKGTTVNADDKDGQTALMFAARKGYMDIVQILLDNGVDVKAKSQYGATALMWAELNHHDEIVELLKKTGANSNNGEGEKNFETKHGDGQ
jgi:ankyrin repeat protein